MEVLTEYTFPKQEHSHSRSGTGGHRQVLSVRSWDWDWDPIPYSVRTLNSKPAWSPKQNAQSCVWEYRKKILQHRFYFCHPFKWQFLCTFHDVCVLNTVWELKDTCGHVGRCTVMGAVPPEGLSLLLKKRCFNANEISWLEDRC